MTNPFNPETGARARGVMPYGDKGTWGHIDLLEEHYGDRWRQAIKETYPWRRLASGEDFHGLTGSIFWAITVAYHEEQTSIQGPR